MAGSRSTFAKSDTLGPAMTSRSASTVRPAAMYSFTESPFVKIEDQPEPDFHRLDDVSLCVEVTKAGNPCKAKKVQGTDYCFSHVRKHRGTEPTAD